MERIINYENLFERDCICIKHDKLILLWDEVVQNKELWTLRLYIKLLYVFTMSTTDKNDIFISDLYEQKIFNKFYYEAENFINKINVEYSLYDDRNDDIKNINIHLPMFWYDILNSLRRKGFEVRAKNIAYESSDIVEWMRVVSSALMQEDIRFNDRNRFGGYRRQEKRYRNTELLQLMQRGNSYSESEMKKGNARYKIIMLFDSVMKSRDFYKKYFSKIHNETYTNLNVLYNIKDIIISQNGYKVIDKTSWIKSLLNGSRKLPCIIVVDLLEDEKVAINLSELFHDEDKICEVICNIADLLREHSFNETINIINKEIKKMKNSNGVNIENYGNANIVAGDNTGTMQQFNYSANEENIDFEKIIEEITVVFEKMEQNPEWSRNYKVMAAMKDVIDENQMSKKKQLLYKLKEVGGEFLIGVCSSLTATACLGFLGVA